jgi:flagellar biogenesis protein FliO
MVEHFPSGQILGLLLLGLLIGAYVVPRVLPRLRQRMQAAGRLQMLGHLALSPQCSVALIRVGAETLVLGVTPQSVTLLTKSESDVAVDTQPDAPGQLDLGRTDTERFLPSDVRAAQ